MELWPVCTRTWVSSLKQTTNRQVPAALLLMLFVYKNEEEKIKAHQRRAQSLACAAVAEALPLGRKHPGCVDPQPLPLFDEGKKVVELYYSNGFFLPSLTREPLVSALLWF